MPHDLVELLRITLESLKEHQKIKPGDPALLELERSILRTLAEMEVVKPRKSA